MIRVLAKSSATLLGLFLAMGFVFTELRPYVDQDLLPVLALPITAVALVVVYWSIRHFRRVELRRMRSNATISHEERRDSSPSGWAAP